MNRWHGYRINRCRKQISNLENERRQFLEMFARAKSQDEEEKYNCVLDKVNEKLVNLYRELTHLQSRNG